MKIDINSLQDEWYNECEECGEECGENDRICALCYLTLAEVEGEA
jgi:hypothetical protein